MDKSDPQGDWILHIRRPADGEEQSALDQELAEAARGAWPDALNYARRKLGADPEVTSLAAEIWETVLQSVTKTRQQGQENPARIKDLPKYLLGAFHYRLSRALRKQDRVRKTEIAFSPEDFERLEKARDARWVVELERAITIRQIVDHMDDSTREIWELFQLGYSWKKIARHLGLNEQQAIMRYRNGLEKTRKRLVEFFRSRQSPPKS